MLPILISYNFTGTAIALIVPPNTEIIFCKNSLKDKYEQKTNGFGLPIFKKCQQWQTIISLDKLKSCWCLLKPHESLNTFGNNGRFQTFPLKRQYVRLAFGCLTTPNLFKCVAPNFIFEKKIMSNGYLYVGSHYSFISLTFEDSRFQIRQDHIDSRRGAIIVAENRQQFTIYICLQGNIEEYIRRNQETGK